MLKAVRSDVTSSYTQRVAISAYYPGHEIRIIGAQGNDALYELYEMGDDAKNCDWLAPVVDEVPPQFQNDQGHLNGLFILEFRLSYTEDESDEPELLDGWELRRPTEDELAELAEGTFTRGEEK